MKILCKEFSTLYITLFFTKECIVAVYSLVSTRKKKQKKKKDCTALHCFEETIFSSTKEEKPFQSSYSTCRIYLSLHGTLHTNKELQTTNFFGNLLTGQLF